MRLVQRWTGVNKTATNISWGIRTLSACSGQAARPRWLSTHGEPWRPSESRHLYGAPAGTCANQGLPWLASRSSPVSLFLRSDPASPIAFPHSMTPTLRSGDRWANDNSRRRLFASDTLVGGAAGGGGRGSGGGGGWTQVEEGQRPGGSIHGSIPWTSVVALRAQRNCLTAGMLRRLWRSLCETLPCLDQLPLSRGLAAEGREHSPDSRSPAAQPTTSCAALRMTSWVPAPGRRASKTSHWALGTGTLWANMTTREENQWQRSGHSQYPSPWSLPWSLSRGSCRWRDCHLRPCGCHRYTEVTPH